MNTTENCPQKAVGTNSDKCPACGEILTKAEMPNVVGGNRLSRQCVCNKCDTKFNEYWKYDGNDFSSTTTVFKLI